MGQTSGERTRHPEIEEWRPGGADLSALAALIPVGGLLGAALLGEPRGPEASEDYGLLRASLVLLATWLLALPLSQWLLLRHVGACPRLGSSNFPAPFGMLRATEQPLPRWAFSLACALPAPVAFVVLPAVVVLMPGGIGAEVLVGIAWGLAVYQLRYALLVLSRPKGTLVEELPGEEGALGFYLPPDRKANRKRILPR